MKQKRNFSPSIKKEEKRLHLNIFNLRTYLLVLFLKENEGNENRKTALFCHVFFLFCRDTDYYLLLNLPLKAIF